MNHSVVKWCDHAARLTDLVSGAGPAKVVATNGRVVIERGGQTVDVIDDPALADFLRKAPARLATLAETVATVYTDHTPRQDGDPCPRCGEPDPCHTRRLIDVRISRDTQPAPAPEVPPC